MNFRKKLETVSKKNLILNLDAMKNTKKPEQNLTMKKSAQIFTIIKYQKKVFCVFAYQ